MKQLFWAILATSLSTTAFAETCGIWTDGKNYVNLLSEPRTVNGQPCLTGKSVDGWLVLSCPSYYAVFKKDDNQTMLHLSKADETRIGFDDYPPTSLSAACLPLKLQNESRSCIWDGEQAFYENGTPVCE